VSADRFARVKELLLAARRLSGDERRRYLDTACAGNPDLRTEVESLLARDEAGSSLIKTAGPIERSDLPIGDDIPIPESIGPFEVIEELGRGGMGVVLRARQSEPIQREVAIKLMGVHLLSESLKLRFMNERQTLASLDHPSIAHVIDAGTDETGRPYLVMELVVGEPITEYCDSRRLSVDERLDLFLQVCNAVSHAHQRGILHRDLKSSNVMVTTESDRPRVKVIDFGIAKVIGDQEEAAGLTRAGQMIGTPDCMSPEQAGVVDAPVDTRTDVYALGILLYELLAGVRPYHFTTGHAREFIRLLDRDGPPTPSALARGRTSSVGSDATHSADDVATRRRATVHQLSQHLRGDLDAIALQALRAHPDERYGSVDRLADDIRRHRAGLPVDARRGGFRYRATKFVRRNLAGVVVGTLALAGIVAFVVAVTAQRNRALEAQRVAAEEAETARRVADFLVEIFEVADPSEARGNSVTAREILDRGVERIGNELENEPAVRARLLDAMGRVYQSLGLYPDATSLLGDALALRQDLTGGTETVELAESLQNYAFVVLDLGEYARAESLYAEAARIRGELLGTDDPKYAASLAGQASVHIQTGNIDAAEPLLERVLAIDERHLGDAHPYVALDYNDLASIRSRRGNYAGALDYYRRSLAINLRAHGPEHPEVATNYANLGVTFSNMGQLDSAVVYDRKGLELREKLLGEEHAHTGISMNNLGAHLGELGRYAEAQPILERSLAIKRATQGPRHRSTGHALLGLGRLLLDMDRLDRADSLLREGLDIHRESVGDGHPSTAIALMDLARVEIKRGNGEAAVGRAREALELVTEYAGGNLGRVASAELLLANALDLAGRRDEAIVHAERAVALYGERYGPEDERAVAAATRVEELASE
jgi:serine/threonine protein kinase/Tfp pilus assembly protein PilF